MSGQSVSEGASILVIDDDVLMLELIALHLTSAGYQVRTAEDAVDGGRMMLESQPDLLLSDINMPYLNGLELVEAMRGDDNTVNVPVIFLSSMRDDATFERARKHRACAFLAKPVTREELLKTVSKVLDNPKPL